MAPLPILPIAGVQRSLDQHAARGPRGVYLGHEAARAGLGEMRSTLSLAAPRSPNADLADPAHDYPKFRA